MTDRGRERERGRKRGAGETRRTGTGPKPEAADTPETLRGAWEEVQKYLSDPSNRDDDGIACESLL